MMNNEISWRNNLLHVGQWAAMVKRYDDIVRGLVGVRQHVDDCLDNRLIKVRVANARLKIIDGFMTEIVTEYELFIAMDA